LLHGCQQVRSGRSVMAAAGTLVVQAEGLGYRRGDDWLFRGLGFAVHAGCLHWVKGPNGRGKTSLLRLLVGLAQAEEGRLTWPPGAPRPLYLGHTHALKDDLTALESLQFLAQLHGRACSAEALAAALGALGVDRRRNQWVRTLSQGQRRRVALSRLALEDSAALWVLDEPFDALDADGIAAVHGLMQAHLDRGGSVVLTSHIPLPPIQAGVAVIDLDVQGTP